MCTRTHARAHVHAHTHTQKGSDDNLKCIRWCQSALYAASVVMAPTLVHTEHGAVLAFENFEFHREMTVTSMCLFEITSN